VVVADRHGTVTTARTDLNDEKRALAEALGATGMSRPLAEAWMAASKTPGDGAIRPSRLGSPKDGGIELAKRATSSSPAAPPTRPAPMRSITTYYAAAAGAGRTR